MKRILAMLALVALPVWAGDVPAGCVHLCGNWVLDATHSESAETMVDAALHVTAVTATDRPVKDELRSQLLVLMTPPASLSLGEQGKVILIRPAGRDERRVYPGEPHSRVDADGTARIRTEWKKGALMVSEKYSRQRDQTDTYSLQPDGTLRFTRVVERPGTRTLRLRAIYRSG